MHKIEIPAEIIERSKRIRGSQPHFLDKIDLARTAHVIVDLQNGFMEEGAPVEVPTAREIVGNVNRICEAVREAGGLNVFLRYTYDPGEKLTWTAFYSDYSQPDQFAMMKEAFTEGAHHFELWPELDVQADDLIVNKTRFSGMIPGTCDLHDLLRKRGIDTLIITGTLTNCCCESTARDAMQMNYKIIFVADGNAAITDAEHNATLSNMKAIFADVMTTDEVVAVVENNRLLQSSAA
ncbi:ureidoacrylate peracid hydrolase [Faunimonas pinastri]|uniref:Ureidoacrylate peracid hydrolase n=1 Tax=Faunimonas pinastri TaxID=1855383 RepID=A0A1H9E4W9_9HYPH|nr:cysteine hydrolase [Faunimonas pinastri]SEQ20774.1 ureidoacrylate peracid hydrolase [Faunimonas pinastri]